MIVRAYSGGYGFDVNVKDWPRIDLIVKDEPVVITSSYNELLALQNLLSEKLAEWKKIQQTQK